MNDQAETMTMLLEHNVLDEPLANTQSRSERNVTIGVYQQIHDKNEGFLPAVKLDLTQRYGLPALLAATPRGGWQGGDDDPVLPAGGVSARRIASAGNAAVTVARAAAERTRSSAG
jgi:hypothetical protein